MHSAALCCASSHSPGNADYGGLGQLMNYCIMMQKINSNPVIFFINKKYIIFVLYLLSIQICMLLCYPVIGQTEMDWGVGGIQECNPWGL